MSDNRKHTGPRHKGGEGRAFTGKPGGPVKREGTVRIPGDVARRVRDGHPWIFTEALRGRTLSHAPGKAVDVTDMEGTFVARALFDPSQNLVLRVFSSQPGQQMDQRFVSWTLAGCLRWRRSMLDLSPMSCYRLLNGDSEGIPAVTVDVFGSHAIMSFYSSMAESMQQWLVEAIAELGLVKGLYLQRRYVPTGTGKARPGAELLWGAAAPVETTVEERGIRYLVDVTNPGSPGLYPDMRQGRAAVSRLAAGRRVLNCFSYTGAFSLVAARAGARRVVSVDASARANAWARRNFVENGLNPDDDAYDFTTGDTFAVLRKLKEQRRRFDIVILDPPTFSSGPKRAFTAIKDYLELISSSMELLEQGGLICAGSNASRLSMENLDQAIGRGANQSNRLAITLQRLGQPPDYPVRPTFTEGNHLKFIVARIDM